MPVEKSGQEEFDFQYGDDFGAHIEKFDPDFAKVLVRYNPDDDADTNERQLKRLKRLADWLHDNDRKFLFELLVPATGEQLSTVGGDSDRYDAELRPELMRQAIEAIQNARNRGRRVEDRGRRRAVRRGDAGRAGTVRAWSRRSYMRAARARRLDREGRAVAAGGGAGRRVHRVRDRAVDLVGRAQGVPRQRARSRELRRHRSPRTTCTSCTCTNSRPSTDPHLHDW